MNYTLTLTVTGEPTTVNYLTVVEAAALPARVVPNIYDNELWADDAAIT
jgi:hypothetical protein